MGDKIESYSKLSERNGELSLWWLTEINVYTSSLLEKWRSELLCSYLPLVMQGNFQVHGYISSRWESSWKRQSKLTSIVFNKMQHLRVLFKIRTIPGCCDRETIREIKTTIHFSFYSEITYCLVNTGK